MSVYDWSTTEANNATADSNINWAEGQPPSTVNDSARAEMARIAHWRNMLGANVTMGGTGNAYTYTTGEGLTAYADGIRLLWSPNADPTGAVTINVDTLGAKKVYMPDGTQAGNGSLDADSLYDLVYDSSLDSSNGAFKIVGFPDTTLTAGDYLAVANNLSDVANASTARSNLGLGTMATEASSDYAALAGATFTGAVAGRTNANAGVSGTLVESTHGRGQITAINSGVTMPTMTGGCNGALITDGTARTVTRGSGLTMYVNGTNVASATIPARGTAPFFFQTASICHLKGDAY
tara:strand:+ start:1751 stop:2632 length:882 start_codon:yes stop_codon:yes gene_type:complete